MFLKVLKCKINHIFFSHKLGVPLTGGRGGGPEWGKISFPHLFLWQTSLTPRISCTRVWSLFKNFKFFIRKWTTCLPGSFRCSRSAELFLRDYHLDTTRFNIRNTTLIVIFLIRCNLPNYILKLHLHNFWRRHRFPTQILLPVTMLQCNIWKWVNLKNTSDLLKDRTGFTLIRCHTPTLIHHLIRIDILFPHLWRRHP